MTTLRRPSRARHLHTTAITVALLGALIPSIAGEAGTAQIVSSLAGTMLPLPVQYQQPLQPPPDARGPAPHPDAPNLGDVWTATSHLVPGPRVQHLQLFAGPVLAPGGPGGAWHRIPGSGGAGSVLTLATQGDPAQGLRIQRGMLSFDTSSIPQGAVIDSARLSSHVTSCAGTSCSSGDPVAVRAITAALLPTSTDAERDDVTAGRPENTQIVSDGAPTVTWELTSLVQQWVDRTAPNHGIAVARADESASGTTVTLAGPQATDPSLVPELDVEYHVDTFDGSAPAAPSDVSVTAGPHSALVSWAAPSIGTGGPVTSWLVTLTDTDSNVAQTAVVTSTQAWFFGLVAGHHLTATVFAQTAQARSSSPATGQASTPLAPPDALIPGAVQGLRAVAGTGAVAVQWAPAADGVPVARYDVVATDSGGARVASTVVCGECTDAVLTGAVARMAAVDVVPSTNFGTSGPAAVGQLSSTSSAPATSSTPASATLTDFRVPPVADPQIVLTQVSLVPGAPGNVTGAPGNASATITWTAASGLDITSYTVQVFNTNGSSASSAQSVCGTCLSATVSGLTNGNAYYATVYATNPVGNGPSAQSPTFYLKPGAPGSVTGTPENASALVTWSAASGSSITSYTAQVFNTNGTAASSPATVCATCLSVTITGLTNGNTYYAQVYATDAGGNGPTGTSPNFTLAVPSAPGSVTGTGGNTTAQVTWTASSGSSISSYTAQVFNPNGSPASSAITVCGTCYSASVTGLTNGNSYYATVYATNTMGNGPGASSPTFSLPGAPSISKTLLAIPHSASLPWSRGQEIGFAIRVFDPLTVSIPVSSVTDTMDSGFTPGVVIGLDSTNFTTGPFCTASSSPTCTINGGTMTVGSFTLAAGASHTFNLLSAVIGPESGCTQDTTTATASNTYGSNSSSASPTLCDGGLGDFPWDTIATWSTGPHGALSLTPGDGNAVVSQDDDNGGVPVHGGLVLGVRRSTNTIAQPAGGATPGMLGTSGWWLTFDDGGAVAKGLTAAALSVPPDAAPSRVFAVTLVDADGGRTMFRPAALATPIDVTALQNAGSTGPLAVTIPRAVALGTGYNRLCVDQVAPPPTGIHASLWRYVEANSSNQTCTPSSWTASAVLGYAVERSDRVRYEFASDGSKLDTQDANGNGIRLHYANDPPAAGKAMGNPSSAVEPATGRALTFSYVSGSPNNELDIKDVAQRTVKYFTNATSGQLVSVATFDGHTLQYVYGGCSGATSTQLCSVSSPLGTSVTTSLTYSGTSSDNVSYVGPPQVAGVTDRRATTTSVARNVGAGTVTLSEPGKKRVYASFGGFNNAGELDVVDPATNLTVTQTYLYWDTAGSTCRQPDAVVDHHLCSSVVQNLGSNRLAAGAANQDTGYSRFVYGAEGQILLSEHCAAMTDFTSRTSTHGCTGEALDTTAGSHAFYVDSSGTTTTYDDSVAGAGSVTSPAGPGSGGARYGATTLYALVDATQSLPPRGNVSGLTQSQWQAFLASRSIDDNAAFAPDQRASASVCQAPSSPTGNSGDVCQTQSPSNDGTHPTVVQQAYQTTGELATRTVPSNSTQHYTFDYFADTDHDLSGTTVAGGWLKATVDPYGNFDAVAYDAAGDPVRTWDRDATAGTTITSFPGTISSPAVSTYSEVLYGTGASAYSAPGPYPVSRRDQLGDLTTYTLDADGNVTVKRPPRGNQAGNSNYDVLQTFDNADDLLTSLTPNEAVANNAADGESLTANEPTRNTYDARGNVTQVTDPAGNSTVHTYDAADRKTTTKWIRGPQYTNSASPYNGAATKPAPPANCPVLSTADGPFPAGSIECTTTTTYDGAGAAIATTDGDGGQVQTSFDPQGHALARLVERQASPVVWETTATMYDEDGNATRVCPPLSTGTAFVCPTATSAYDTVNAYTASDRPSSTSTYRQNIATPVTTTFAYDGDGNQIGVTDPSKTTTSTFNLLDRRTNETYPRTGSTSFSETWTYSPAGDVLTDQDADGHLTAKSYDAAHRLIDTVQGSSSTSAAQAGPAGAAGDTNARTRMVYDADSHVIAQFDPRAFATSVSSPDQRYQTKRDYDLDGRPIHVWQPYYDNSDSSRGNSQPEATSQCPTGSSLFGSTSIGICETEYRYDADGHVVAELLPTAGGNWSSPRQVTIAWTADGYQASQGAPSPTGSGTAVTYTFYDASGRTVETVDPLGTPDTRAYSPDGLVLQHNAEPLNNPSAQPLTWHCETFAYDGNGNKLTHAQYLDTGAPAQGCSNTPQTESWTYSTDNHVLSHQDSGGDLTSYTLDLMGNPVKVYSPSANAKDSTNPLGLPTTNTYTQDNLLASTQVPTNSSGTNYRTTTYTYTGNGSKRTVSVSSTSGTTTTSAGTQTYDWYPDNRLQDVQGRSGEKVTYQYDAAGHPTNITTAAGNNLSASYWLNDWPESVTENPVGGGLGYTYSYDGSGDTTERTTRGYGSFSESLSRGDAGQVTALTDANLGAWSWTYDANGRPATQNDPDGGNHRTFAYNTDGTLYSLAFYEPQEPLASNYNRFYDSLYRVTSAFFAGSSTLIGGQYQYYNVNESYQYDSANHLTSFTHAYNPQSGGGSSDTLSFTATYDHNGNRTSWGSTASPSDSKRTDTYNPDDSVNSETYGITQAVPNGYAATYSYNSSGTVASDGCENYGYDGFDEMTSVSPVAGNHCGANASSTFAYDGLHRQVSHTDGPYNLQTVVYHDGFSNNLSMEQHQWLPLIANRDLYYVLDGNGVALADGFGVNGGFAKAEYLGYDGFGNVQRVTNSSGDPIATPFYDPYGAPLNDTIAGHGGAADTLGYKAQSRNGTTGDYHLGLRDYNPASGAFLQPDSFLDSASGGMDYALAAAAPGLANPRAYAGGDPANFWDPTGHNVCRENPQDCSTGDPAADQQLRGEQAAGSAPGVGMSGTSSGPWTSSTHSTAPTPAAGPVGNPSPSAPAAADADPPLEGQSAISHDPPDPLGALNPESCVYDMDPHHPFYMAGLGCAALPSGEPTAVIGGCVNASFAFGIHIEFHLCAFVGAKTGMSLGGALGTSIAPGASAGPSVFVENHPRGDDSDVSAEGKIGRYGASYGRSDGSESAGLSYDGVYGSVSSDPDTGDFRMEMGWDAAERRARYAPDFDMKGQLEHTWTWMF